MNTKIQELKYSINKSYYIISKEQDNIKKIKQQINSILKSQYTLENMVGKPYQRHRSKWGSFQPEESNALFDQIQVESFNHLEVHDILSGADLNITLGTEFFVSHSNYIVFVEYDMFEDPEDPDISIYEYLIFQIS